MNQQEVMGQVEVFTLDAFAQGNQGGNPAGVVLGADGMSEEDMQRTASIVGFSETAFIMESSAGDYRARYFTPSEEVDLCGHATLAAFSVMVRLEMVALGSYRLETKAGILKVSVHENGDIFLSQALPQFYDLVDRKEIADSLGIRPDELSADLPMQIVSTGLRDILVPVQSLEILRKIQPDFEQIKHISQQHQVIGYHLFTLDTGTEALAHCRNFAPLYEIPEESATGTSNGALLCHLHKYGKYIESPSREVVFEQGYTMNRPSEIKAKLKLGSDGEIVEVQVGGAAANLERRMIKL